MALRAFRCNPSLGGFGGENRIFPTTTKTTNKKGKDNHHDENNAKNNKKSKNNRRRKKAVQQTNNEDILASSPEIKNKKKVVGKSQDHDSGRTAVATQKKSKRKKQKRENDDGVLCSSSDDDAFAQIVKELVDNAVDACSYSSPLNRNDDDDDNNGTMKRVKVVIVPVNENNGKDREGGTIQDDDDNDEYCNGSDILRITVSDNGCGMSDISKCVNVFSSSKNASSVPTSTANTKENDEQKSRQQRQEISSSSKDQSSQLQPQEYEYNTAGRYGIGLTLCMLHTQRLVPKSYTLITSSTPNCKTWTRSRFVVDTQNDEIKCIKTEKLLKGEEEEKKKESGTIISMLVPGGNYARRAWPRLAEYLSRFHLSGEKLCCSVEVMASCLSRLPLFIRPIKELSEQKMMILKKKEHSQAETEDSSNNDIEWRSDAEVFHDDDDDDEKSENNSDHNMNNKTITTTNTNAENDITTENKKKKKMEKQKEIQKAAMAYLNCPIELQNIAHSINPIIRGSSRVGKRGTNNNSNEDECYYNKEDQSTHHHPTLEVTMIVYNGNNSSEEGLQSQVSDHVFDDNDENELIDEEENEEVINNTSTQGQQIIQDPHQAKLMCIRMVNQIPLLDGVEAHACGLVRGIISKQTLWNSFGLDVTPYVVPSNKVQQAATTKAKPKKTMNSVVCDDDDEEEGDDTIGLTTKEEENIIMSQQLLHIPTFTVKDSVQVAPYFQSSTHALFNVDDSNNNIHKLSSSSSSFLLPVGLRLGNILLITNINAKPSALPLPTLSKGRLPTSDKKIDQALELGISKCLNMLQKQTSGSLLLSPSQLKRNEREVRYIPSSACSIASIICQSKNEGFQRFALDKILRWKKIERGEEEKDKDVGDASLSSSTFTIFQNEQKEEDTEINRTPPSSSSSLLQVNIIGPLLEDRIRHVLSYNEYLVDKEKAEKEKEKEERKQKKMQERLENLRRKKEEKEKKKREMQKQQEEKKKRKKEEKKKRKNNDNEKQDKDKGEGEYNSNIGVRENGKTKEGEEDDDEDCHHMSLDEFLCSQDGELELELDIDDQEKYQQYSHESQSKKNNHLILNHFSKGGNETGDNDTNDNRHKDSSHFSTKSCASTANNNNNHTKKKKIKKSISSNFSDDVENCSFAMMSENSASKYLVDKTTQQQDERENDSDNDTSFTTMHETENQIDLKRTGSIPSLYKKKTNYNVGEQKKYGEYHNLMSDDEHTNDTDNKDIKQITLTKEEEEEEDSLKQEFSPTTATRGQTITTRNNNKGVENVQKEKLSLSDEFTSDIEDDDDDKDDYFCPNNSFNVHSINEIETRRQHENNLSSPSPMDDGEFSIIMPSSTHLTTRGEQNKQHCSDSNTPHHDKSLYFSRRVSSDLRPQCTTTTKNEITRHLPSKQDEIEQQSNGSSSEDVGFTSDIHDDDDDMDHFLHDGSNCFPPNMMKGSYSKAAELSSQVEEQTTNVSNINFNNVEHDDYDDDGFNSDIEDDSNNNCDHFEKDNCDIGSVIQVVENQNWSDNLHEDREVVETRCSYDRFDDGFTSDIEEDG